MSTLEAVQCYGLGLLGYADGHSENQVVACVAQSQNRGAETIDTQRTDEALNRLENLLESDQNSNEPKSIKVVQRLHHRRFRLQLTQHVVYAIVFFALVLLLAFASGKSILIAVAIGYLVGTLFTAGIAQHAFVHSRAIGAATVARS